MESIYWYVILASGTIIIIALGGLTIYYRNKLEKCKTTLIRYINENIEMKEKLPEYELPNFINNEEITPSEFTKIMTNVMKRLMFIASFLILLTLPLSVSAKKPTLTETEQSGRIRVKSITENAHSKHFTIRANLLRWATLTPDLGVEWFVTPNLSVLVNGSWTTWSWNDKDRRYALREIMPEVRWYLGKERRGYIGAMYKAGAFNYKFSELGKQGNINGCGVSGGYVLPLNNRLSLDFSLALGYLHAAYDTYQVTDGVRVRDNHHTKSWFGPVNAGVTLSWIIF